MTFDAWFQHIQDDCFHADCRIVPWNLGVALWASWKFWTSRLSPGPQQLLVRNPHVLCYPCPPGGMLGSPGLSRGVVRQPRSLLLNHIQDLVLSSLGTLQIPPSLIHSIGIRVVLPLCQHKCPLCVIGGFLNWGQNSASFIFSAPTRFLDF